MDPRFEKIKESFLAALDLPASERAAYIERVVAGDEDMRREIEGMILADVSAVGVFNLTGELSTPHAPPIAIPLVERPRESIGSYRILGVLGRGGMGTVYEAEQSSPRRRVALKVIRADLAGTRAFERFRLESEILGRLEHEGIARIYESSSVETAAGDEPFIAMEFVDGLPLSEYVKTNACDRAAILLLLEKTALAVAHAHQRGIIHRDLKPANVLVLKTGQPKILDFGISRLTDDARTTHFRATLEGEIFGTLGYMSPEQAGGKPDDVDTRSDVYALGVIAYELFSGVLPCGLPRSSFSETIRAIRDVEPDPLGNLVPGLDRDIAVIVHCALEKDRNRRYATATALAEDIRRHLESRPIAARPASAAYQLEKFARRHRVLVAGVVATFLALVGGIVATTRQISLKDRALDAESLASADAVRQMERAKEQTKVAEAAREAAEDRVEDARVVRRFLEGIISSARPDLLGQDARVIDALNSAAASLESEFAERPKIEASVRMALGGTYLTLGLHEESGRHLREAVRLAEIGAAEGDPLVAEARLGLTQHLFHTGEYHEAQKVAEQVIEAFRKHPPKRPLLFCRSLRTLAEIRASMGDAIGAEKLFQEFFQTFVKPPSLEADGGQWDFYATALEAYGLTLRELLRLEDARARISEALDVFRAIDEDSNIRFADAEMSLALILDELGRSAEAEPLCRSAIEIATRKRGDQLPTAASYKSNLAGILVTLKRLEEARGLAEEAVASLRRIGDGRSVYVAHALTALGGVDRAAKEWDAAASSLREGAEIFREKLGPKHVLTRDARRNLANTLVEKGKGLARLESFEDATYSLTEAQQELSEVFGDRHSETRAALEALIDVLRLGGRADEAAPFEARLAAAAPK